jgi:hypothetical protein
MALAVASLGPGRRDWALAMERELAAASDEGRALAFAWGCLIAAWRDMPREEEGRFTLAKYALALGLVIPIAALELTCAAGLPPSFLAGDGFFAVPALTGSRELYLSWAYLAAQPALLGLWFLLSLSQLRLAWGLLENDWPTVVRAAASSAACTAALLIVNGTMLVADGRALLQAAMLPIEFLPIATAKRWHAELVRARLRIAAS